MPSLIRTIAIFSGILVIIFFEPSFAQKKKQPKLVQITLLDGSIVRGRLYAVNKTSLEFGSISKMLLRDTILADSIKSIAVSKRRTAWTGFALGVLAGGTIGAIILVNSYPTESTSNVSNASFNVAPDLGPAILAGAITLGGGLMGAAIYQSTKGNSFRVVTYEINGDQRKFNKIRLTLKQYM